MAAAQLVAEHVDRGRGRGARRARAPHARRDVPRSRPLLHAVAGRRSRRQALDAARPPKRAGRAGPTVQARRGNHARTCHGRARRSAGREDHDARDRRAAGDISATGASPRTVNKYRSVISAVFNYGCKPSTFALPANPASGADKRREPHPGALVFYSPEEIEAIARALAEGRHRDPRGTRQRAGAEARQAEDHQDAEIVRVAAYAGLRQGELLALRWRDVDFAGSALTIARAMSAGVESSTKSGRVRRVPLADQAAAALDRMSRREHFTAPDDLVFCNVFGRPLDGSALRRRYRRAQAAAGVRALRFHDLRHTFGSLLAARGVDVVTIQKAMGHSALSTTSRYLHARPASEQAQVFTAAFNPTPGSNAREVAITDTSG